MRGRVGRPLAADEAVEDLLAQLGRDAGAVVGDFDDGVAAVGAQAQFDPRARRRVAGGVVEQVERPGGAARRGCPRPAAAGRSRPAARVRRSSAPPRPRRCPPPRPGRTRCGRRAGRRRRGPGAGGRRRGGSSGSRSAAPSRPSRARPRGWDPRSEACSSSRLATMLVSGVRSSCEASATNSRCFRIAASRSERAASSERSISSRVSASSPTSSSVLGCRHVAGGVAGVAISRAVAVSEEIGRIARPAIASPARAASRVAPRTPAAMKSQSRSIVESMWCSSRPYWT